MKRVFKFLTYVKFFESHLFPGIMRTGPFTAVIFVTFFILRLFLPKWFTFTYMPPKWTCMYGVYPLALFALSRPFAIKKQIWSSSSLRFSFKEQKTQSVTLCLGNKRKRQTSLFYFKLQFRYVCLWALCAWVSWLDSMAMPCYNRYKCMACNLWIIVVAVVLACGGFEDCRCIRLSPCGIKVFKHRRVKPLPVGDPLSNGRFGWLIIAHSNIDSARVHIYVQWCNCYFYLPVLLQFFNSIVLQPRNLRQYESVRCRQKNPSGRERVPLGDHPSSQSRGAGHNLHTVALAIKIPSARERVRRANRPLSS